jgi:KUP system potassium uptake protein
VLGSVILALLGAEALYADIGHFRSPGNSHRARGDRASVDCYRLLRTGGDPAVPAGIVAPTIFYAAPHWALVPPVIIAMLATIIASQTVISGALSMTSQAIELRFMPRMRMIETLKEHRGPMYVPVANAILFAAVLVFRSSPRLTSAYGIAVALTTLNTTIQMINVAHNISHWPRFTVALVCAPLLVIDGARRGSVAGRFIRRRAPNIMDCVRKTSSNSACKWCFDRRSVDPAGPRS